MSILSSSNAGRARIEKLLEKCNLFISNVEYSDLGIIYHGDMDCHKCRMTEIPIHLHEVTGDVILSGNLLTSLCGAPSVVGGSFYCDNNNLVSLEGAPSVVGDVFNCCMNKITSLKGGPSIVGSNYYCDINRLASLKGSPRTVGGSFRCDHNILTSLDDGPETVGFEFNCEHNELVTLHGAPLHIGSDLLCSNNRITAFDCGGTVVGESLYCIFNQLTSLEGHPKGVKRAFNVSHNKICDLKHSDDITADVCYFYENPITSIDGLFTNNNVKKGRCMEIFVDTRRMKAIEGISKWSKQVYVTVDETYWHNAVSNAAFGYCLKKLDDGDDIIPLDRRHSPVKLYISHDKVVVCRSVDNLNAWKHSYILEALGQETSHIVYP